ncbi:hypothetical protein [Tsukamurella paurometabola]|uniref:hypothetical protein n=1 Tax=Tsukamurella paurometabola TaxID=2061 RepID=UPI000F7E59BE|nr:hypothetical protein [Tsukamurella paurometabola]UEA83551.1 hypothetical protein LK411_01495 [Tsukamurella paurometabola]
MRARVAAEFSCESMPAADRVAHARGSRLREPVTRRGDLTEVDERSALRGPPRSALVRRIVNHVN